MPAGVLADEERRFHELTNQQMAAMQMFRLFPQPKAIGCAGSGKTLLRRLNHTELFAVTKVPDPLARGAEDSGDRIVSAQ